MHAVLVHGTSSGPDVGLRGGWTKSLRPAEVDESTHIYKNG